MYTRYLLSHDPVCLWTLTDGFSIDCVHLDAEVELPGIDVLVG